MKYDFDTIIDRKNTNSIKYDFPNKFGMPEHVLPMWVADMDFQVLPEVAEAIQKVTAHGIFGYSEADEGYYEAVINWFSSRFGYTITEKEIVKTPGVVFGLVQMIRAFTKPSEGVLIQTPVYHPFYHIIRENGRKLVTNPLKYDSGRYTIDFEDFEYKIKSEQVKLFLLCSPHNPVGRVWEKSELERMQEICCRNDVIVISDEIHCDFVWSGHKHISFASVSETGIVATAPSKTFNLAGLQVSNIFIRDVDLRNRVTEEVSRSGYEQLNTLGLAACQSAYLYGGEWLTQLKAYLAENIRMATAFLSEHLPSVRPVTPEGTYLLWLDFSAYGLSQEVLDRRMIHGAGLWLDSGTKFGSEGAGFQRMNIACPREVLKKALFQMEKEFLR